MPLNERIREARRAKGKSQAQLGQALGVSREAVAQWESGETAPTLDKFEELAKALDVSGEWLVTGRGARDVPKLTRTEDEALHLAQRLPGADLERWLEAGRNRLTGPLGK